MITLNLQPVTNLAKIQNKLETFVSELPQNIEAAGTQSGAVLINSMYMEAPVKTGDLSHSMRYEVQPNSNGVTVSFQNNMFYANFVARGHLSRGGNFVPPNNYPGRAAERSKPELLALLKSIGAKLV